ncbi:hypothetical protein LLE49_19980 [Alicyclobacillus tolerans]|uniref:hypothetical protein n=1 Tax=Alicyclobacillus tolerans TaxID=90970 RepID=UPI001F210F33|nr:hypothetical protein [Alicyclobacillus tolerans]MCF8567003.1 hypothetical protein [Alicyclobacillus tolerans]
MKLQINNTTYDIPEDELKKLVAPIKEQVVSNLKDPMLKMAIKGALPILLAKQKIQIPRGVDQIEWLLDLVFNQGLTYLDNQPNAIQLKATMVVNDHERDKK